MNSREHSSQPLCPRTRTLQTNQTTIVAAVDIGTSKTSCLIAQLMPLPASDELVGRTHSVKVLGIGHSNSRGVKSGTVYNFDQVEHSVRQALAFVEGRKFEMRSALLSASGGRIASEVISASVDVTGMVSEQDITRVLTSASPSPLRDGRVTLHCMPNSYSVGAVNGIRDPRKMLARRLGVDLLTVSIDVLVARNLMLALESCHLNTEQLVASPYAAGLSVLTDDEMELGAAVIDMGAGVTTIGVFAGGGLIYASGFALGGHHVTMDLARGIDIRVPDAERLKIRYGIMDFGDMVSVRDLGADESASSKIILRSAVLRIIKPRVEEILEMVRDRLAGSPFSRLPRPRVVLTGGASQLEGLPEIAARILVCPVRVGLPHGFDGLSDQGPALAVATGLLIYPQAAHLEHFPTKSYLGTTTGGYFAQVGAWFARGSYSSKAAIAESSISTLRQIPGIDERAISGSS